MGHTHLAHVLESVTIYLILRTHTLTLALQQEVQIAHRRHGKCLVQCRTAAVTWHPLLQWPLALLDRVVMSAPAQQSWPKSKALHCRRFGVMSFLPVECRRVPVGCRETGRTVVSRDLSEPEVHLRWPKWLCMTLLASNSFLLHAASWVMKRH